jgi:ribosomal protein L37AE/L43A
MNDAKVAQKEMQEEVKPRCPRCKRTSIRYRVRRKDYLCLTCGHAGSATEFEVPLDIQTTPMV